MCQRAVAIHEKLYGRNHPGAAPYLNNWAMALKAQVRDDADSRYFLRLWSAHRLFSTPKRGW